MPIDNATWHARVGSFYALKTLLQYKSKTRKVPFLFSSLTFCHWNLNGLTAHDSIKISLLQAYILQHNYDIIMCIRDVSEFFH